MLYTAKDILYEHSDTSFSKNALKKRETGVLDGLRGEFGRGCVRGKGFKAGGGVQ